MGTETWSLRHADYVSRVWQLRYFWMSLVKKDIRTRYRNSTLGIGWSLVRPLAMATVLCLVFSKLINIPIADYAPFLLIGLTIWQFLYECIISGCTCFQLGGMYIRQQPVPLIIFPLRTALGAGLHSIIALLVAILVTIYFRGPGCLFGLGYLLPALVLCFLLGWALALLSGLAFTYFPDSQHIFEISLQILLYLTPILYPAENFLSRPRMFWLLNLNPLTHVLALFRVPLLDGAPPALAHSIPAGLFIVFVAVQAFYCLRKLERTLVFWI